MLVIDFGRGAARAEDAQGTSTQSHISPSKLLYENKIQSWGAGPVAGDDALGKVVRPPFDHYLTSQILVKY